MQSVLHAPMPSDTLAGANGNHSGVNGRQYRSVNGYWARFVFVRTIVRSAGTANLH